MVDSDNKPAGDAQNQFLLGQIHAMVTNLREGQQALALSLSDGQKQVNERLESMDERLRTVEQRSAALGAVSGGVMGVGMTLIIEGLRQYFSHGGPKG